MGLENHRLSSTVGVKMVLVGGGYARRVCGWVETREGGEEGAGFRS